MAATAVCRRLIESSIIVASCPAGQQSDQGCSRSGVAQLSPSPALRRSGLARAAQSPAAGALNRSSFAGRRVAGQQCREGTTRRPTAMGSVGDKVLKTSAVFETEMWGAAEFGRTMYTIKTRVGNVTFKMQEKYGVKREVAGATDQFVQERRSESREGPVVVIDNYDSFTYNLCQYLGDLGCEHVVFRNDEISVPELREIGPRGILISPGPGTPEDSGISLQTVRELGPSVPLFGVCMGLQCIGQAFGGRIVRAPHGVMHGKTSPIYHNQTDQESGLLVGLSNPFTAARYHSLVIERETFPEDELEVTAWTEDGLIMGARHRKYPHIEGVQFHPESIITQNGKQIVNNFLLKLALVKVSQSTG